jgi:two-component system sensor histidine kinase PilS (NtrC family)
VPASGRRPEPVVAEASRGLLRRPLLPSGARDAALLQRQLKSLVAIRLVVVTSVFLLYFLISLLPDGTSGVLAPRVIFLLLGLAYGFSLGYIALLGLDRHPELQAYMQFVGDLLLITALVYWFGGISSPFTMLYLVVISVAATLLRRRAALLVANIAYLLYAATQLALHFGWLPPARAGENAAPSLLYYNLAIHFLGFYGVALLTSYLARNVTLAERELAEKRESLADLQVAHQDVVQSISAGLLTTDGEGRVTSVNRAGEQLLRRDGSWLVGRHAGEIGLLPPDSWGELVAACRRGERVRTEFEHGGTDGKAWYGFTMTALTDAHGRQGGYILIFQDLTEWRALQAELRIKDRMAAVGELAAGLAHEIGNPLAAISGSVQLLAPGARELDPQRSQLLSIVLRESQRLDRTIKSFLQFARPKERESSLFDIAALLAEHVELLRNSPELSAAHEVELALAPPSARVMGDADQISQIFWNLARNAIKAMPHGGRLTISGRLLDGVYQLRVADTGRGMSAVERDKLFQPFKSFFDEGSGLGMAIVYRIVQEHGGRLQVESAPGRGSAITVELPAGQAPAAAGLWQSAGARAARSPAGGRA